MPQSERVGITPKSWTIERHYGVLHLGKRWYAVTADIDAAGRPSGVRLDGPYDARSGAETAAKGDRRGGESSSGDLT